MDKFVSLANALEGHYHKPLAKLPIGLRKRVEQAFLLLPWDSFSQADRSDWRRRVAREWDAGHDPAFESERQRGFASAVRISELERQIQKWETASTPTALDLSKKEERLAALRQELKQTRGLRGPNDAVSGNTTAQDALQSIYQPAKADSATAVPERRKAGRKPQLREQVRAHLAARYPAAIPWSISVSALMAELEAENIHASERTISRALKAM